MEVKPALPLDVPQVNPSTILSSKGNERLVIPIRLREQVIGLIGLESEDPEHRWTEDEIAVLQATAEQAALTVENARLLAESQQKAFREQMTGEITTRMRSSLDMETVLRTAMNEIAQRLGVAQVEVQLGDSGLKSDQKERESTDLPKSPKGDGRHE
jgi:GAF domain-containing protein